MVKNHTRSCKLRALETDLKARFNESVCFDVNAGAVMIAIPAVLESVRSKMPVPVTAISV
jgi:hypothetical protein